MKTLDQRFWEKVSKGGDCWEWVGAKAGNGRPMFSFLGRPVIAYRMAYELTVGEIPEGKYVCHSCDNGGCVNPAHLWLGTQKENLQDASKKGRMSTTGPTCDTHGMRKLSSTDVEEIFLSKASARELAAEYHVTPENIYMIRSRKTWRKITDKLL